MLRLEFFDLRRVGDRWAVPHPVKSHSMDGGINHQERRGGRAEICAQRVDPQDIWRAHRTKRLMFGGEAMLNAVQVEIVSTRPAE